MLCFASNWSNYRHDNTISEREEIRKFFILWGKNEEKVELKTWRSCSGAKMKGARDKKDEMGRKKGNGSQLTVLMAPFLSRILSISHKIKTYFLDSHRVFCNNPMGANDFVVNSSAFSAKDAF